MTKTYAGKEVFGYFEYDYSMTVDKRLSHCPYGQCGVIFTENGVDLYSYTTMVISIKDNWLYCTGTYSATTRKHIGCFLKEYAPRISYYTVKQCYYDNMEINIETGEVRKHEG